MSAEKNNMNSASQKEALSKNSNTVVGDIYVQDVHKYFGVTRALNGCNFSANFGEIHACLLYTSPSPRDATLSRMPSSA